MQFDLFDSLPTTLIDVAPQAELPKVLAQHSHGVQLGTHFVPYQLLRSKRRSIGFLITDQGLRVTAPRWVTIANINEAIVSKQRWILKKLHEHQNRPPSTSLATNWTDGATLPFLGQAATLRLQPNGQSYFDCSTRHIVLNLPVDTPSAQCQKHLHTWLMHQARDQFSERLPFYADQLGVQYHSFALTSATTLWGSCNVKGKIRLNWRLIHVPPHLMDYVIAHELAHLHEMNHSPRFWKTVERVFPDYVAARNELRRQDLRAMPRF